MTIYIDIATAFAGGIPESQRRYRTGSAGRARSGQRRQPLLNGDLGALERLTEEITQAIRFKLLPTGVPIRSFHPILEAALAQDARNLAAYLLWFSGNEFRALLELKSLLSVVDSVVRDLQPSKAYEPVLQSKGCDPLLARALAHLALRIGRQLAETSKCRKSVVEAIRIIATPTSQAAAVRKAAAYLIDASDDCSAVETLFYEANLSASEFLYLLHLIIYGGEVDERRLIEIATDISSRVTTLRGRKLTPASAAHEFLLEHLQCGYTWDIDHEDFSD